MEAIREALRDFYEAESTWRVAKTTDAYTELLRAHARVIHAFSSLFAYRILPILGILAFVFTITALLSVLGVIF